METIESEDKPNDNQNKNEIYETQIAINVPEKDAETKKINTKRKNRQEKVEKIIQKWLKLQKTIKEEITLEEVIIKQQNDDFNYLKDLFTQYYETKIKSRRKNYDLDKVNEILSKYGFTTNNRAEELSYDIFVDLCNKLF